MFDIKNSKDVNLEENKTTDPQLLKADNIDKLNARGNVAGLRMEPPRTFAWFRDNIAVTVIGSLIVILVVAAVVWKWPAMKEYLR